MKCKNIIPVICALCLFCRCNQECKKDWLPVPEILFSIIDIDGNDLIHNGTYNSNDITLLDANGRNILLNPISLYDAGATNPSGADALIIMRFNDGLEQLNGSDYYLNLDGMDIDTLHLNVTETADQCGIHYYQSNSFSHNGIVIDKSDLDDESLFHYYIIK